MFEKNKISIGLGFLTALVLICTIFPMASAAAKPYFYLDAIDGYAVDVDGDWKDDGFVVEYDVDCNGNRNVEVEATLYDPNGKAVDTDKDSFKASGIKDDVRTMVLVSSTNTKGYYSIYLALYTTSDGKLVDEVWIKNIYYYPGVPKASFYSVSAKAIDKDGDGYDDYIEVRFDVDIDQEVKRTVTITAELYKANGNTLLKTGKCSYTTVGDNRYSKTILLYPPKASGTIYYDVYVGVNLSSKNYDDTALIEDIKFNQKSTVGAYFVLSKVDAYTVDDNYDGYPDRIRAKFDVNLDEDTTEKVTVNGFLYNSKDEVVDSHYRSYYTTYDKADTEYLTFTPTNQVSSDIYAIHLNVNDYMDEVWIINILFVPSPPKPYFNSWQTSIRTVDTNNDGYDEYIKASFDVDVNKEAKIKVTVYGYLYDSKGDIVDYAKTTYDTYSTSIDPQEMKLVPTDMSKSDDYKVELTVRYSIYSDIITKTVRFDRENDPPVANAGENKKVKVNTEVQFSGAKSYDDEGDTLTFEWDFGDGTKGTGSNVKHTYTNLGTYKVTLKVTTPDGKTSTDTITVEVKEKVGLPGFEILLFLLAIGLVVLVLKKKKH
ncbi:MAG: PKD domain-containing protein [Candidatus Thermoplasmatota archaeon]